MSTITYSDLTELQIRAERARIMRANRREVAANQVVWQARLAYVEKKYPHPGNGGRYAA